MSLINRRSAIEKIVCGAVLGSAFPSLRGLAHPLPEEEIAPFEREQMARAAEDFMGKFDVPGLSVAIARQGRLLYETPFGYANRQAQGRVAKSSLFRIASVTKPITSTTIFTLIERGQLQQNDRVFGTGAVLGTKYGTPPYKRFVEEITIDHLLTHTCGGWDNSHDDPMFENPQMNHHELISWTLDTKPLINRPGTHWAYSNFGYCVLGRVIEEIRKRPYAEYVHENILARCGIRDMRIAFAQRGDLLRPRRRKPLQHECRAHGFARRLAGDGARPGAFSESRGWLQDDAEYYGSGNDQEDDHAQRCKIGLCTRMGGQRSEQLVAQRESARNDNNYGAHVVRFLLGCSCQHACARGYRRRARQPDLGDGAQG
jgi:CubicO group peptidase (beta-lactamase class C family)